MNSDSKPCFIWTWLDAAAAPPSSAPLTSSLRHRAIRLLAPLTLVVNLLAAQYRAEGGGGSAATLREVAFFTSRLELVQSLGLLETKPELHRLQTLSFQVPSGK